MNHLRFSKVIERTAFICGCGHSGTTLVATILSAHQRVHVPLYESEAFLHPDLVEERLATIQREALAAGKRILVEKTPRHVRRMDLARRIVPEVRFILLVRDGRDVAASIARRYPGNYAYGISRWISDNNIVFASRAKADVLLLRYEDLIEDPPCETARLCAFLGVPYSDELLQFYRRPRLWYGQKEIRRTSGVEREHDSFRNWQVNQPIFDGRGRWKQNLPPEVSAQFTRGRAAFLMTALAIFPSVVDPKDGALSTGFQKSNCGINGRAANTSSTNRFTPAVHMLSLHCLA